MINGNIKKVSIVVAVAIALGLGGVAVVNEVQFNSARNVMAQKCLDNKSLGGIGEITYKEQQAMFELFDRQIKKDGGITFTDVEFGSVKDEQKGLLKQLCTKMLI